MAAINHINNKIIYNPRTNREITVEQRLNLLAPTSTDLLNFSTDALGNNPLFSIKRSPAGDLFLHFDQANLLVDGNGSPMPSTSAQPILLDPSTYVVNIKPKSNESVGQEIEVKVRALNGTSLILNANATSVSVKMGNQEFGYQSQPNQTLSMGMTEEAIEMYMGKRQIRGSGLFEHPTTIDRAFPLPILGMYASQITGNTRRTLGNFNIFSLDFQANGANPYIIIQDRTTNENMLYANGALHSITGYIGLHRQQGALNYYNLALVSGQNNYELILDSQPDPANNNQIAPTAQARQALSMFSQIGIPNATTNVTERINAANGVTFEFTNQDPRDSKTVNFRVTPIKYTINAAASTQPPVGQLDINFIANLFISINENISILIEESDNSEEIALLTQIRDILNGHSAQFTQIAALLGENNALLRVFQQTIDQYQNILNGFRADFERNHQEIRTRLDQLINQSNQTNNILTNHTALLQDILANTNQLQNIYDRLGVIEQEIINSRNMDAQHHAELMQEMQALTGQVTNINGVLNQQLTQLNNIGNELHGFHVDFNNYVAETRNNFNRLNQLIEASTNRIVDGLDRIEQTIHEEAETTRTTITAVGAEIIDAIRTGDDRLIAAITGGNADLLNELRAMHRDMNNNSLEERQTTIDVGASIERTIREEGQQGRDHATFLNNQTINAISSFANRVDDGFLEVMLGQIESDNKQLRASTTQLAATVITMPIIDEIVVSNMKLTEWNQPDASNKDVREVIEAIQNNLRDIVADIRSFQNNPEDPQKSQESFNAHVAEYNVNVEYLSPNGFKADAVLYEFATLLGAHLTEKSRGMFSTETERIISDPEPTGPDGTGTAPIPPDAVTYVKYVNITNNNVSISETLKYTADILNAWINAPSTDSDVRDFMNNMLISIKYVQDAITNIENATTVTSEMITQLNNTVSGFKEYIDQLMKRNISQELKEYLVLLKKQVDIKKGVFISTESDRDRTPDEVEPDKNPDQVDPDEKDPDEAEEKKEEKKDDAPVAKEVKMKDRVERASLALFILSFACLGGILVPGLAPLFIGLAMAGMATAVITKTYADKFNYTIYERAHNELTQAEQEELEDQEAVEDFMANEQQLDKYAEQVGIERSNVEKLLGEEDSPLKPLVDAYNNSGNGFYPTNRDSDPKRTNQLLGTDGHDIRHTMLHGDPETGLGGLNSILNAKTPEEKRQHVNAFIENNFSPDMPPEERAEMEALLYADPERNPQEYAKLHALTTGMQDLEDTENVYNALLTTQKSTLGGMRDELIRRVINDKSLNAEGKREAFLDRYGPTIIRHCMLDDNMNQQKLDALFDGLSLDEKEKCIDRLITIGERMGEKTENLQRYTEEVVKPKLARAELSEKYVEALSKIGMSPDGLYSTREELTASTKNYIDLQTCRTNQNIINDTTASIDRNRIPGNARLDRTINAVVNVPAPDVHYNEIFTAAENAGFNEWFARQYVETPDFAQGPEISGDTWPKGQGKFEYIGDFLAAHPDDPSLDPLRQQWNAARDARETLKNQQRNALCEAVYAEATEDERRIIDSRLAEQGIRPPAEYPESDVALATRLQAITERLNHTDAVDHNGNPVVKRTPPDIIINAWFDENKTRFMDEAAVKLAPKKKKLTQTQIKQEARRLCRLEYERLSKINPTQITADRETYVNAWAEAYMADQHGPDGASWSRIQDMIEDGSIADMKFAEAQNGALGIDGADIDARVDESASNVSLHAAGNFQLEYILEGLPPEDRVELRQSIGRRIQEKRAEAEARIAPYEASYQRFKDAWDRAVNENDYGPISNLLRRPTRSAPDAEKRAYLATIKHLKELGIDVTQLEKDINAYREGTAAGKTPEEIRAANQDIRTKFEGYENDNHYSTCGDDVIDHMYSSFAPQTIIREELHKKYGGLQIETGAPTADQILERSMRNNIPALLEHFPAGHRQQLATEIRDYLNAGADVETAVRLTLEDRYSSMGFDQIIPSEEENDAGAQERLSTRLHGEIGCAELISQWMRMSARGGIENVTGKIHKRGGQEVSCVASTLGHKYANELYERFANGEQVFEEFSREEVTRQEARIESDLQAEINLLDATQKEFEEAWRAATHPTNPNLDKLAKLILKPTQAEKREMATEEHTTSRQAYRAWKAKMDRLRQLGINVDDLQSILDGHKADAERLKSTNLPPEERTRLEEEEEKRRIQAAQNLNKTSNFVETGREFIGRKLAELQDVKAMHRAETPHDVECVRIEREVATVESDALNISGKYGRIQALRKKFNWSNEKTKNILRYFETGNLYRLSEYPELKGMKFTRNDVDAIRRLGLGDEKLSNMTPEEVQKTIQQKIAEAQNRLKNMKLESQDARIDPTRSEDLTTRPNATGQMERKRFSLIGMLRNISNKIKYKKQRDLELQAQAEADAEHERGVENPAAEAEVEHEETI